MPIEVIDVELEELKQRYAVALHAVQSGIAMAIEVGETLATPKHLRVGVESAHVTDKGFAQLLIAKGIITEREYVEAVTVAMEDEKEAFEKRLSERLGTKVTLG